VVPKPVSHASCVPSLLRSAQGVPSEDPDAADKDKKIIPLGARPSARAVSVAGACAELAVLSSSDALPCADEDDIALLKTYGLGPYSEAIKGVEADLKALSQRVNDLCGVKESDTGLSAPSQWDLVADKQAMAEEHPLQVARCTKIISPGTEDAKYVINVKQTAKFVVALADKVSPSDIEEGMRVGVDRTKYAIHIPLPAKIDSSVTMMTVEEKPDVTYADIGGCKEQIEKMREVVELPLLHPEKFVRLGIDPPKGVLCYGPPGAACASSPHSQCD